MHMIPRYRWFMLATDFDGLTTRYTDMWVDTYQLRDVYIVYKIRTT